jgi:hypothetical protein
MLQLSTFLMQIYENLTNFGFIENQFCKMHNSLPKFNKFTAFKMH